MLDGQVKFLKGWFQDTLPTAPIDRIALLRFDGDMYGSTMDCLRNLYHKVSKGGFIIIDDYGLPGCRAAIDDFREEWTYGSLWWLLIEREYTGENDSSSGKAGAERKEEL